MVIPHNSILRLLSLIIIPCNCHKLRVAAVNLFSNHFHCTGEVAENQSLLFLRPKPIQPKITACLLTQVSEIMCIFSTNPLIFL